MSSIFRFVRDRVFLPVKSGRLFLVARKGDIGTRFEELFPKLYLC